MTTRPQTWTVIRLLRDCKLPRFRMFEGETCDGAYTPTT